mgnify:CR=1 FL=1
MRVVFDTNVYVAALIGRGKTHLLLQRALRGEFEVVTSYAGLAELPMVMRVVFHWSDEAMYDWHKRLGSRFSVIRPATQVSACRDASDNMWLACAWEGKAHYLVSRDKDLLTLGTFMGIQIVTVEEFWEILIV